MKFWGTKESYRAGDRIFAILQHPDVALLLNCESPGNWTAMVFDLGKKQAVALAQHQPSCADAQNYAVAQVQALYKVTPQPAEVRWQQALNRPDILQT